MKEVIFIKVASNGEGKIQPSYYRRPKDLTFCAGIPREDELQPYIIAFCRSGGSITHAQLEPHIPRVKHDSVKGWQTKSEIIILEPPIISTTNCEIMKIKVPEDNPREILKEKEGELCELLERNKLIYITDPRWTKRKDPLCVKNTSEELVVPSNGFRINYCQRPGD